MNTDTPETDATTCLRCAESDRNFRAALRVIANLEETIHRMDFQKKLNRECIDQITARTKERDEARAQLDAERALTDRLAGALRELRDAEWLTMPGRANDIVEAALTTLNQQEP